MRVGKVFVFLIVMSCSKNTTVIVTNSSGNVIKKATVKPCGGNAKIRIGINDLEPKMSQTQSLSYKCNNKTFSFFLYKSDFSSKAVDCEESEGKVKFVVNDDGVTCGK